MQKVLVLGGATGLLGQAIVEKITSEKNWQVNTLGRTDGDIFDAQFMAKYIENENPDIIFNTVAWTQVDDAEDHEEEALKINAGFPQTIAKIIKNSSCHLVHFSTDFVFNGQARHSYAEDDEPNPESSYGRTKLAGEKILLELIPEQVTICRTAWLFGPHRKNFVATICQVARKNGQLKVVSDQIGSPTYTRDLAAYSIELAAQKKSGIWHTVNSGQASWYDLASFAVKAANIPCQVTPIPSDEWPQKAKRPPFSVLNTDKLAKFLKQDVRPWQEAVELYAKEKKL